MTIIYKLTPNIINHKKESRASADNFSNMQKLLMEHISVIKGQTPPIINVIQF